MIDINKRYRYRNGEEARILCVDRTNDKGFSVVSCDNEGDLHTHTLEGLYTNSNYNHLLDLIEVKEKKVLWINVYGEEAYAYKSRIHADSNANKSVRKALVKVEYEEGQFDE